MKLETGRLILRDFIRTDWERVLEYQNDPLYLRYNRRSEPTSESAKEFVGWFLAQQGQEPRIKFQLAITLKSNNLLIGNCGVRMDKYGAVEADIGYELDSKYWNHGYATEAAHAMTDFGFSNFRVHRIWATCVTENTQSAHVMEKLGMKLEGRFRENQFYKNRWWDSLMYAILANEWEVHKESHPVRWTKIEDM